MRFSNKKWPIKGLSVAFSLALFLGTVHLSESAAEFLSGGPHRFRPPISLGRFIDSYQGPDPRTVVLLQDLHINYSVQKHIQALLQFYDIKRLLPSHVAVEGAAGPIDASLLADFPDRVVRRNVADYFVRKGELTGAGAYAVESGKSRLLFGIEDQDRYDRHLKQYQESFRIRNASHQRLNRLELGTRHPNRDGKDIPIIANDFVFLKRLLKEQVTHAEWQKIDDQLPRLQRLIQTLPGLQESEKPSLRYAIQAASSFYVAAINREQPMVENTLRLLAATSRGDGRKEKGETARLSPVTPRPSTAVLVVGGFHTSGITKHLRSRGISYAVIQPQVDEINPSDEQIYYRRLLDQHVSAGEVLQDARIQPTGGVSASLTIPFKFFSNLILRHPIAIETYLQVKKANPTWDSREIVKYVAENLKLSDEERKAVQAYLKDVFIRPHQEVVDSMHKGFVAKHHNIYWDQWIVRSIGQGLIWIATYAAYAVEFLLGLRIPIVTEGDSLVLKATFLLPLHDKNSLTYRANVATHMAWNAIVKKQYRLETQSSQGIARTIVISDLIAQFQGGVAIEQGSIMPGLTEYGSLTYFLKTEYVDAPQTTLKELIDRILKKLVPHEPSLAKDFLFWLSSSYRVSYSEDVVDYLLKVAKDEPSYLIKESIYHGLNLAPSDPRKVEGGKDLAKAFEKDKGTLRAVVERLAYWKRQQEYNNSEYWLEMGKIVKALQETPDQFKDEDLIIWSQHKESNFGEFQDDAARELLRRAQGDNSVVNKLIGLVENEMGSLQRMAVLTLVHATGNERAQNYVNEHWGPLPKYWELDRRKIQDDKGQRYTLEVNSEYPSRGIYLGVVARNPTKKQNWEFASSGRLWPVGKGLLHKKTVAFRIFSQEKLDHLSSIPKMGKLSHSDLKKWLNRVVLTGAETLPQFRRRGIYKSMMNAVAKTFPPGTIVTVMIARQDSIDQLEKAEDKSEAFWNNTLYGKVFKRSDFEWDSIEKRGRQYLVNLRKIQNPSRGPDQPPGSAGGDGSDVREGDSSAGDAGRHIDERRMTPYRIPVIFGSLINVVLRLMVRISHSFDGRIYRSVRASKIAA